MSYPFNGGINRNPKKGDNIIGNNFQRRKKQNKKDFLSIKLYILYIFYFCKKINKIMTIRLKYTYPLIRRSVFNNIRGSML